jgi:Skp family chaperone for outer membrane proteins
MENKTTRKLLALFLLLALVLAFGCAKAASKAPAGRVQVVAAPVSTANAVSDVDSDLAEIDALDQELANTDLDNLDNELDIQI